MPRAGDELGRSREHRFRLRSASHSARPVRKREEEATRFCADDSIRREIVVLYRLHVAGSRPISNGIAFAELTSLTLVLVSPFRDEAAHRGLAARTPSDNDMASMSLAEPSCESLATALSRVAASADETCRLHSLIGPYCHQAKNLLNGINLSRYLARRDPAAGEGAAWAALDVLYLEAEGFLERLQQICRPIPLYLVTNSIGLLIDNRAQAWSDQLAHAGRNLIVSPPDETPIGDFDPARLEKGFNDLVAWRTWAGPPRTDLRVAWTTKSGKFRITWDEPVRAPRLRRQPYLGPDSLDLLAVPLLYALSRRL